MRGINNEILNLIKSYDSKEIEDYIIQWAPPIICFGNIEKSKIASVGINPSNKEFVNNIGNEITGYDRRFPTLNSLNILNWDEIDDSHIFKIKSSYENYFNNNSYDIWFKKLDFILSGCGFSYYFPSSNACHIDLVPFTTKLKWGSLKPIVKLELINHSNSVIEKVLSESSIETLILNGQSVVDIFKASYNCDFIKREISSLDLFRKNGRNVKGIIYQGTSGITNKNGVQIKVIGYNHNIQSSFGITNTVLKSLRIEISKKINNHE